MPTITARHLFVWAGGLAGALHHGVLDVLGAGQPLPPGPPMLPVGITHFWLACYGWLGSRVLLADGGTCARGD